MRVGHHLGDDVEPGGGDQGREGAELDGGVLVIAADEQSGDRRRLRGGTERRKERE